MPQVGQAQHAKDFDTLMDVDFKLHTLMSEIESKHVKEEDIAHLPANILLDSQQLIHSALPVMAKYPKLKNFTDQVKLWVKGLDDAIGVYPPDGGQIYLPYNVLMLIKEKILNFASNNIHDAALASAGDVTHLKGCEVKSFKGDDAVAISKYCGGVVPISGKALVLETTMKKLNFNGVQKVVTFPTQVQHSLGCHKVKPSFMSLGPNKTKLAIQYSESGPSYAGSPNRMKGVKGRLELEGMECSLGTNNSKNFHGETELYCWGEKKDEDIKLLGTYFSLLLNGDIAQGSSSPGYDEVVRDKAWEIAKKYNQQYGEDVWQKAPQQQLSWGTLFNELKKEKELYAKQVIYEDLRDLLIIRDKHHALEVQYGVEQHSTPIVGMKLLLENAQAFEKILKKNKWPDNKLSYSLSQLEAEIKMGKAQNITGLSDGIGHIMHILVVNRLVNEGSYGGCRTDGSEISNINAGNLSYCEGVLKGTQATLAVSGNEITHKALPNTAGIYIGDEDLSKGYRIMVTPPGEGSWKNSIDKYLKKLKYDCSSGKCSKYEPNLNSIRQLALFLSNLKGVSEKVGDECALKAIAEAEKTAIEENKKGVFAFNADVILDNPKAWINKCQSQYGILPPGLTEEEKIIMKLIGPSKIYAGCDLSGSDIVPNMGYIRYCEGIRKNPAANISGYFTADGELQHLFHGQSAAHDQIATVSVNPDGKLWQVEIKDIDLKNVTLRDEAKKAIKKNWGLNCSPGADASCTTKQSLDDSQIRTLAAFLSSLHQVYKLDANCVPAAVQYAVDTAMKLPKNKTAHDSLVYPFETADWMKMVCGKVPGSVTPKITPMTMPKSHPVEYHAPSVAVKKITPQYIEQIIATQKKGYPAGGCLLKTSTPLPKAKAAYCAGVMTVANDKSAWEAQVGSIDSWHKILGDGNVVFDSKGFYLTITLPQDIADLPGVIKHLTLFGADGCGFTNVDAKTYTYKRHYSKYSSGIPVAALFLSRLANVHKIAPHYQKKAVEFAWNKAKSLEISPIYPATVEDWNNIVGEMPVLSSEILSAEEFLILLLKGYGKGKKLNTIEIQPIFTAAGYQNALFPLLNKLAIQSKIKHEVPNLWWVEEGIQAIEPEIEEAEMVAAPWNYPIEKLVSVLGGSDIVKCFSSALQIAAKKNANLVEENSYFGSDTIHAQAEVVGLEESDIKALWTKCYNEWQEKIAVKAELKQKKVASDGGPIIPFSSLSHDEIAIIKQTICDDKAQGVTLFAIMGHINSNWPHVEFDHKTKVILTKMYEDCGGMKASSPTPSYSDLIQTEYKKTAHLYSELSTADLQKAKETKEYKKLPSKVKEWLHSVMAVDLLKGENIGIPYDEVLDSLKVKIIKQGDPIPITPKMVELQTEIEKKRLIRKGYIQAEPGQKVSKKYGELSPDEKQAVYDFIDQNPKDKTLKSKVMEHFGLIDSPMLHDVITKIIAKESHKAKAELVSGKNIYEDVSPDAQKTIKAKLKYEIKNGATTASAQTIVADEFNLAFSQGFHKAASDAFDEIYGVKETESTLQPLPKGEEPVLTGQPLKDAILSIYEKIGNAGENAIISELKGSHTVNTEPKGNYGTVYWAIKELEKEGLIESLGMSTWGIPKEKKSPSFDITDLIEAQNKVWDKLSTEVYHDKDLLGKCKDAKEYKKLPQKCKDLIHAYMNKALLIAHKKGTHPNELLAEIENTVIKTFPNLTKKQVKLQLEIEKKNKIRKGELPAEAGKPVAKKYEDLSKAEQSDINDTIINLIVGGIENETQTIWQIQKKYGLVMSDALIDLVNNAWIDHKPLGGEISDVDESEIGKEWGEEDAGDDDTAPTLWDELSVADKTVFAKAVVSNNIKDETALGELAEEFGIYVDFSQIPPIEALKQMGEVNVSWDEIIKEPWKYKNPATGKYYVYTDIPEKYKPIMKCAAKKVNAIVDSANWTEYIPTKNEVPDGLTLQQARELWQECVSEFFLTDAAQTLAGGNKPSVEAGPDDITEAAKLLAGINGEPELVAPGKLGTIYSWGSIDETSKAGHLQIIKNNITLSKASPEEVMSLYTNSPKWEVTKDLKVAVAKVAAEVIEDEIKTSTLDAYVTKGYIQKKYPWVNDMPGFHEFFDQMMEKHHPQLKEKKVMPSLDEIKTFILKVIEENPGEKYTGEEIADLMAEAGYLYPGLNTLDAIEALCSTGEVPCMQTSGKPWVIWYKSPTKKKASKKNAGIAEESKAIITDSKISVGEIKDMIIASLKADNDFIVCQKDMFKIINKTHTVSQHDVNEAIDELENENWLVFYHANKPGKLGKCYVMHSSSHSVYKDEDNQSDDGGQKRGLKRAIVDIINSENPATEWDLEGIMAELPAHSYGEATDDQVLNALSELVNEDKVGYDGETWHIKPLADEETSNTSDEISISKMPASAIAQYKKQITKSLQDGESEAGILKFINDMDEVAIDDALMQFVHDVKEELNPSAEPKNIGEVSFQEVKNFYIPIIKNHYKEGHSVAEVLKHLQDTFNFNIDDALMTLVLKHQPEIMTEVEEEPEQVDSDAVENISLIDYSDLPSEDEPQVDADIEKAVRVGTTKNELLQYLEEAYNLAPDNPTLNDLIDKAYAKEKPAKKKKIIAESSWGGAKKDYFSLSHYLMELLKNNPEVAFTAAMANVTILNTKGVNIIEAEVDEILTELVKSGHVIVYETKKKTYQWNPNQPKPEETIKQIPFSSLPDPTQSSIHGLVCVMKKQGNSLVEIFDWFAKSYPHVEFGAMTKGILTNIYEKGCVEKTEDENDVLKKKVSFYENELIKLLGLKNDAANDKTTSKENLASKMEMYAKAEAKFSENLAFWQKELKKSTNEFPDMSSAIFEGLFDKPHAQHTYKEITNWVHTWAPTATEHIISDAIQNLLDLKELESTIPLVYHLPPGKSVPSKLKLWADLSLKEQEKIAKFVHSSVDTSTAYAIKGAIQIADKVDPNSLPDITWLTSYGHNLAEAEKSGIPLGAKITNQEHLNAIIKEIVGDHTDEYKGILFEEIKDKIYSKGYEVPHDDAVAKSLKNLLAAGFITTNITGYHIKKKNDYSLNELADAFKTLGIGAPLAGCVVKTSLKALTPGVVAYCQGVQTPKGFNTSANVHQEGTQITHTTQSQTIKVKTAANKYLWNINIQYKPSPKTVEEGGVVAVQDEIKKALETLKFECGFTKGVLDCEMGRFDNAIRDTDVARIRQAAAFLSGIDNVHLLPATCIPKAISYALKKAAVTSATPEPFAYPAFPSTLEDWDTLVCSAKKIKDWKL